MIILIVYYFGVLSCKVRFFFLYYKKTTTHKTDQSDEVSFGPLNSSFSLMGTSSSAVKGCSMLFNKLPFSGPSLLERGHLEMHLDCGDILSDTNLSRWWLHTCSVLLFAVLLL